MSIRIIIPILALLFAAGCTQETAVSAHGGGETVYVVVEPVRYSNELTRLEAVGTARAVKSVVVKPVASAEVVAVNFAPGQRVTGGDVLVELDSRSEVLAVELAGIHVDDTSRLLDRYQRSADTGAVLPTTLDAARTAYQTARVELEQARVALEDRQIRAPFSGYVGISDIDRGDRVEPSTEITTLDDRDTLLVRFEVPEILIGRIAPGDRVAISTWNSRGPSAYGDIVDIGSRIDPVTRTFTARASVDNQEDSLRPGMSFRVSLAIEGAVYPVIPEIALQWGAEGAYVWAVRDDRTHRVPVSVIQRQEGEILVESALRQGELIVVEGVQSLYEGMDVNARMAGDAGYGGLSGNLDIRATMHGG